MGGGLGYLRNMKGLGKRFVVHILYCCHCPQVTVVVVVKHVGLQSSWFGW